jgi:exonuclease VII small subunit/HAMP domain-containing protein
MEIFNLIPVTTWLSIVFLLLLSIVVGVLRISLYNRLQEINKLVTQLSNGEPKGKQPYIVNRLEKRYGKASEKLEYVNTIALIDNIYKDETISYCMAKIQYDRADGITKALPNLLIAFGLIGTFLGITSNLTNISEIVTGFSDSSGNITGLVQKLQKPLQDMGIAFSASLVGLSFGSVLTIVNTIWNTSIAKHQLIASLEDYLDNIYKQTIKGHTRLDEAINRMVNKQQEFLTRFHENIGATLERSFGRAENQIAEECSRINQIAENVYTNFSNAAGTMSTGASTFQYAANSLEQQTNTLGHSLNQFQGGVATFNVAANKLEQNNIIQNIDRVLAELNATQQAFASSTQTLQDSLIGITESNQTAAQLAQQVYETWQDSTTQIVAASETIGAGAIIFQKATTSLEEQSQTITYLIPQLKTGVDTFVAAANKVKTNNIIKHLNTLVENLGVTQSAFASSTETLATGVEGILSSHQQATQIAEQVYQGLEKTTNSIQSGANNFVNAAQIIRDSSLANDLDSVANKWQNAQAEFTNSTTIFSQATKNLQPVAAQLEPAITSIDRAVNSLQQVGVEVVSLSQHNVQVSESTQNAIDGFNRNCLKVLNNTDLSIQDLGTTNKSNWQSLVNILEPKIQTDRESLQRLLAIIEKLDKIVSNIDNAGNGSRSSGLQGRSKNN